jgi:hypothetical protein
MPATNEHDTRVGRLRRLNGSVRRGVRRRQRTAGTNTIPFTGRATRRRCPVRKPVVSIDGPGHCSLGRLLFFRSASFAVPGRGPRILVGLVVPNTRHRSGYPPSSKPRPRRAASHSARGADPARQDQATDYRCPFGPPGPTLARAWGGPLNLVPGKPDTDLHRAVSCPPTGCADSPSPGPSCHFGPGQHEVA